MKYFGVPVFRVHTFFYDVVHADDLTSLLCYFHINSLFVACITPPLQEIDALFPSVNGKRNSIESMYTAKGTGLSFHQMSTFLCCNVQRYISNAYISFSSFFSFLAFNRLNCKQKKNTILKCGHKQIQLDYFGPKFKFISVRSRFVSIYMDFFFIKINIIYLYLFSQFI